MRRRVGGEDEDADDADEMKREEARGYTVVAASRRWWLDAVLSMSDTKQEANGKPMRQIHPRSKPGQERKKERGKKREEKERKARPTNAGAEPGLTELEPARVPHSGRRLAATTSRE